MNKDISFSELAEEYVLVRIYNPKTAKNYRGIASLFEKEAKVTLISDVDMSVLIKWKDKVLSSKTNNTFNTYLRHIRVLIKYAIDEGYISYNIFSKIKSAPAHHKLPKTVETNIVQRAISFLESDSLNPGWFWKIVVRFFITTGIRRKQLLDLKWSDIDYEKKELLLSVKGSKNNREWYIPLDQQLINDLKTIKLRTLRLRNISDNDQVFNVCLFNPAYRGNKMTDSQLDGFFRRLSDRVGAKITPHRMRHSLGYHLGNQENVNLFVMQDFFGHSDLRTTRIYVRTNTSSMRTMLNKQKII